MSQVLRHYDDKIHKNRTEHYIDLKAKCLSLHSVSQEKAYCYFYPISFCFLFFHSLYSNKNVCIVLAQTGDFPVQVH